MSDLNILTAFALTLFAGLATGIGSAIAFFAKRTNTKFLSVALGFSAGVMIYVSFVEIFFKAKTTLVMELGNVSGCWVTVGAFFFGFFVVGVIDRLVPSFENPHEMHKVEELNDNKQKERVSKLFRVGLLSAFVIALHNVPEGLVTFTATLKDPKLGMPIAIAIAIHNIPEGIAVSIPIYYATGSRKKAFYLSFFSGLAEPIGAVIGFFVLRPFLNEVVFGILFAFVAGIMVFISFDQLLPSAEEYGEHHLAIYGLVSGMVVMALSLLLFL